MMALSTQYILILTHVTSVDYASLSLHHARLELLIVDMSSRINRSDTKTTLRKCFSNVVSGHVNVDPSVEERKRSDEWSMRRRREEFGNLIYAP